MALRADNSDTYRIQEAALEMNECMRTGQRPDEADIAFHMAIAQASHNPRSHKCDDHDQWADERSSMDQAARS